MKEKRNTLIIAIATLAAGLLLGWLIFGTGGNKEEEENLHDHEMSGETFNAEDAEVWTCSMHPQIRQDEPGDCPICGMDLIPLENEQDDEIDAMAISMSPTAMELADVRTAKVILADPVKHIRMSGKVKADERLVFSQSSHLSGRVEKLMVNFTGEYISKGSVIASIYAPELVTAQEELLEAYKIKETQPQLFNAARTKLKNWKLPDSQIEEILRRGSPETEFDIRADVSGYVTAKKVNRGDYISRGETLYEITDLSRVWVLFDLYEKDMSWVSRGDKLSFTVASLPGKSFESEILWIDPLIDPDTRVAKARAEIVNRNRDLKPGMFVSGTVQAELTDYKESVVVPSSAVMWTGKRSLVYVKSATSERISFMAREVTLGPSLGDSFIIESGLQEGEEIAVAGTFSIDAAAQLAGKPSMMNPEGGAVMTGHNHGGTDMSEGEVQEEALQPAEDVETEPAFTAQLTEVYNAYLLMKDAFVATDAGKVKEEAEKVREALDRVDMSLLKGDAHMLWMDQLEVLNSNIVLIAGSGDIEEQRAAFIEFNQAFYESVSTFGLNEEKVYYQYCPMADNDRGAYWLSGTEEIRNPYFGDKMLKCGETREVLKWNF
ncbi:MAG: efflux RND transporter periplasmic adaptor subunit [Bacteroidales bacterium]|nr:efflux RND transporter periplasmic adaptor subunit [Bacteroidales bacterium]